MFRQLAVLLGVLLASSVLAEDNILTWDHDGVTLAGFYVYHKPDGGTYTRVHTIFDDTLRTYTHVDQSGVNDCYQLSAFNDAAGESGLTNEACKTTVPNAPTNLQVN